MTKQVIKADRVVEGILLNRMMWRDPIAAQQMNNLVTTVNSTLLSRQAMMNGNQDPRRDIDAECGYPQDISPECV